MILLVIQLIMITVEQIVAEYIRQNHPSRDFELNDYGIHMIRSRPDGHISVDNKPNFAYNSMSIRCQDDSPLPISPIPIGRNWSINW